MVHHHCRKSVVAIAVGLQLSIAGALPQGTLPAVLRTGSGPPLVSDVRTFQAPTNSGEVLLRFEIGFSTEENPQPGLFLDSFTVTLQSGNTSALPVLCFTMDSAGVV